MLADHHLLLQGAAAEESRAARSARSSATSASPCPTSSSVVFLVLLGVFFWLPFWAFFNLCALYVDSNLDTARALPGHRAGQSSATGFAGIFSATDDDGVRRVLGETISHTGYIIMVAAGLRLADLREVPRHAVVHVRPGDRRRRACVVLG